MENPATWKQAEAVIINAHEEWHKMIAAGAAGPSIGSYLANALRKAGLLNDASEPALGWHGVRDSFPHRPRTKPREEAS